MTNPFFIIVSGATGVGKTAFVDELIPLLSFPVELINADMGQLYQPLTIGTAKPALTAVSVPHHMFDIISEPVDFTASEYRNRVLILMKEITSRGAVPLLVGGSGFYVASLFYPPTEVLLQENHQLSYEEKSTSELWELLNNIDPTRAQMIHKHDRYRLMRALQIFYETGRQPSLCEPIFDPPGRCAFYFLTRDQQDLHSRINTRTSDMLEQGWFDEVRGLSKEWHEFLVSKKLIGYKELIEYIHQESLGLLSDDAYEQLGALIAQKTRGYAKRQITFWKHLKKRLASSDPQGEYLFKIEERDLSTSRNQLLKNEGAWLVHVRERCS
jgi:tRNA dimethylallyltransferase